MTTEFTPIDEYERHVQRAEAFLANADDALAVIQRRHGNATSAEPWTASDALVARATASALSAVAHTLLASLAREEAR